LKKLKDISLTSWTLFLIGLVSLLPFILLSFYTVPNLEDYAESIIPGVWWHVKFLYLTYDGRFFTSFMFAALNPLKYQHFTAYQWIPLVLIVSLFLSFFLFIRTFLFSNKMNALCLSAIILSLYFIRNPNLAYSFYYMISSYVYMLPSILFIVYLSISYRLIESIQSNFPLLLLSSFLIFCIAGGNELYLIPLLLWLMFLWFKNYRQDLHKHAELFALSIALFCAFFIVFTSPGTQRFVAENKTPITLNNLFDAANLSFNFTLQQLRSWYSCNLLLLFLSLLIIYFFQSIDLNKTANWSLRKSSFLFFLSFVLGLFIILPYTFAAGGKVSVSYTQIYIIPYLYYTLIGVLFLATVSKHIPKLPRKKVISIGLLTFIILSGYLDKNNQIKLAYQDLISGSAKAYYNEVNEQISRSLKAPKSIELCFLKNKPRQIFSGVYFNQETENFHLAYRLYYHIDELIVKECP